MRLPSAARLPHRPEEKAEPQVQGKEVPDGGVPGTSAEDAKKLGPEVPATTTNAEVGRLKIRKSDLQFDKTHLDKRLIFLNFFHSKI